MGEVLERLDSPERPTVAVAEAIPEKLLIAPPEFKGAHDPHVWFDLELWGFAVDAVRDQLMSFDPPNASEYSERAEIYRGKLARLHNYARAQFARVPEQQRVLVTAHDAFNYLGAAYGLEVRGLQGISTASVAGVKDVDEMVNLIVDRKIKAVFVESSVSPKAIEAVREHVTAKGHNVVIGGELFSDAMGDEPPTDTYVGMVRANVRTVVDALR